MGQPPASILSRGGGGGGGSLCAKVAMANSRNTAESEKKYNFLFSHTHSNTTKYIKLQTLFEESDSPKVRGLCERLSD